MRPDSDVAPVRFNEGTPEFGRIANLSDGVFAIALTLLVLTLDVPDVPADQFAWALFGEAQQVVIFALSFLLVANIWAPAPGLAAGLVAAGGVVELPGRQRRPSVGLRDVADRPGREGPPVLVRGATPGPRCAFDAGSVR